MTKLTKRFAAPQFPRLVELKRCWKGDGAAQIVEFAISLPLLVLLVVEFCTRAPMSTKRAVTTPSNGARICS